MNLRDVLKLGTIWADEMKQINEYEQVSCPECKGVFHPMTLDIEHALDCSKGGGSRLNVRVNEITEGAERLESAAAPSGPNTEL